MLWAAHNTEQGVKNLLAIGVVGVFCHHVNALENRLLHKVVCGHEPPDPTICLKDTRSGINVNQSTGHTYNKMKRQEGGLHLANLGGGGGIGLVGGEHMVKSQEAKWPQFVWQAQQVQLQ